MEYAQYHQPHHGHSPALLYNYGWAPGNASITSLNQQTQMHPSYQQTYPILPSQQGNPYNQGGPPNPQHQAHQQMGYPQGYGVQPGIHQQYGISPTQAAIMATVAATGLGYYNQAALGGHLAEDSRGSPRMSGATQIETDGRVAPRSPNSASGAMSASGMRCSGHAFKRPEDPPRNAANKMICVHEDCANLNPTFDRKCEWSKHMDKHDRPYKCQVAGCEKLQGFTYSGGLLRHEREVHKMYGGTKKSLFWPHPNSKRSSGPGFTRKENLHKHIRRVHRHASGRNDMDSFPHRIELIFEKGRSIGADRWVESFLEQEKWRLGGGGWGEPSCAEGIPPLIPGCPRSCGCAHTSPPSLQTRLLVFSALCMIVCPIVSANGRLEVSVKIAQLGSGGVSAVSGFSRIALHDDPQLGKVAYYSVYGVWIGSFVPFVSLQAYHIKAGRRGTYILTCIIADALLVAIFSLSTISILEITTTYAPLLSVAIAFIAYHYFPKRPSKRQSTQYPADSGEAGFSMSNRNVDSSDGLEEGQIFAEDVAIDGGQGIYEAPDHRDEPQQADGTPVPGPVPQEMPS